MKQNNFLFIRRLSILLLIAGFLPSALSLSARRLQEFLPAKSTSTAVVVCPGGSYCWLSKKTEGREVGQWLADHGIAAYVLYYPTAGWAGFALHSRWLFHGRQHPDQINALNRALEIVRSKGYRRVGAMGFSAGGHLVLQAAAYSPRNLSPDFVAPIYPVVSMSHPCVHRRSRRGLLGECRWRDKLVCDSLSMERHADRICCPVFMINCTDDPIVNHHNAELMDSALTVHRVPHFYRQYRTGGHGFGVNPRKTSEEAIEWKEEFLKWVKAIMQ